MDPHIRSASNQRWDSELLSPRPGARHIPPDGRPLASTAGLYVESIVEQLV